MQCTKVGLPVPFLLPQRSAWHSRESGGSKEKKQAEMNRDKISIRALGQFFSFLLPGTLFRSVFFSLPLPLPLRNIANESAVTGPRTCALCTPVAQGEHGQCSACHDRECSLGVKTTNLRLGIGAANFTNSKDRLYLKQANNADTCY